MRHIQCRNAGVELRPILSVAGTIHAAIAGGVLIHFCERPASGRRADAEGRYRIHRQSATGVEVRAIRRMIADQRVAAPKINARKSSIFGGNAQHVAEAVNAAKCRIAHAAKRICAVGIGEVRIKAGPALATILRVHETGGLGAGKKFIARPDQNTEHAAHGGLAAQHGKVIRRHTVIQIQRGVTVSVVRAFVDIRRKAGTRPHGSVGTECKIAAELREGITLAGDRRRLPLAGVGIPIINQWNRVRRTLFSNGKGIILKGHECRMRADQQRSARRHCEIPNCKRIRVGRGTKIEAVGGHYREGAIGQVRAKNSVRQRGVVKIRPVGGDVCAEASGDARGIIHAAPVIPSVRRSHAHKKDLGQAALLPILVIIVLLNPL